MLVIENNRFVWRNRLFYFASPFEVERVMQDLGSMSVARICQTTADLPDLPCIVEKQVFKTSLIDLDANLDAIFGDMSRTSRTQIRRGEKLQNRLRVVVNGGADAESQFFCLYRDFSKRKNLRFGLTRRLLAEYLKVSDLWLLYLDGQLLCAHVLLVDPAAKRVRPLFSVSTRLDGRHKGCVVSSLNRYLHWQEMQKYKAQGIHTFDFGGIGDDTEATRSIAFFKLSLGGQTAYENNYVLAAPFNAILYRARRFGERLQMIPLRKSKASL
jgi:Acetyltransferase (GNAT) domain